MQAFDTKSQVNDTKKVETSSITVIGGASSGSSLATDPTKGNP